MKKIYKQNASSQCAKKIWQFNVENKNKKPPHVSGKQYQVKADDAPETGLDCKAQSPVMKTKKRVRPMHANYYQTLGLHRALLI